MVEDCKGGEFNAGLGYHAKGRTVLKENVDDCFFILLFTKADLGGGRGKQLLQ